MHIFLNTLIKLILINLLQIPEYLKFNHIFLILPTHIDISNHNVSLLELLLLIVILYVNIINNRFNNAKIS